MGSVPAQMLQRRLTLPFVARDPWQSATDRHNDDIASEPGQANHHLLTIALLPSATASSHAVMQYLADFSRNQAASTTAILAQGTSS